MSGINNHTTLPQTTTTTSLHRASTNCDTTNTLNQPVDTKQTSPSPHKAIPSPARETHPSSQPCIPHVS